MAFRPLIYALLGLVFAVLPAAAHGPTPQKLDRAIEIATPPAQVWGVLGELSAVNLWHPQVEEALVSGPRGQGAQRRLTLSGGGTLLEGIDRIDDAKMTVSFRLSKEDITVFPVSFYQTRMTVEPTATGSRVTWASRYYRGDTGNFPAPGQDDPAAVAAMEAFATAGLEGLKTLLER